MMESYESLVAQSKDHFIKHEYSTAFIFADRAIKKDPLIDEAYFWAGISAFYENRFEKAESNLIVYANPKKSEENNFLSYYLLMLIDLRKKNNDDARSWLRECTIRFKEQSSIPSQILYSSILIMSDVLEQMRVLENGIVDNSILDYYGLRDLLTQNDDAILWAQVISNYWGKVEYSNLDSQDYILELTRVSNSFVENVDPIADSKEDSLSQSKPWKIEIGPDQRLHPKPYIENSTRRKNTISIPDSSKNCNSINIISKSDGPGTLSSYTFEWNKTEKGYWVPLELPNLEIFGH